MLDVLHPLFKKTANMVIDQNIKGMPAIFADRYQSEGSEQPQLMRHSGLGHSKQQANFTDAHFLFSQQTDDSHPSWVSEGFEEFGDLEGRGAVKQVGG